MIICTASLRIDVRTARLFESSDRPLPPLGMVFPMLFAFDSDTGRGPKVLMRSQRLIAQWLLRQGWLSLSALRHWLEHSGHGYSGLHLLHVHRLYDAWRRGNHQPLCHTNKLHWTQYRRAQSGIQHRTASPTDITHTLYIATSMLCSQKSISQRKRPNRACSAQKAGGTYRRFKYIYICIYIYMYIYIYMCVIICVIIQKKS